MNKFDRTNENYWKDYDGLQNAKHQLLASYLGAWFPILTSFHGRVLYIDCHAGRGKHDLGQVGSPILALQTLLNHRSKEQILKKSEVAFVFIEKDEKNFRILQEEIKTLGALPAGINVLPYQEDYEKFLRHQLGELEKQGVQIAPSFAFVDPYGFDIPMDLLNTFLRLPRTELFINLMFRYIDMSVNNPSLDQNMDHLFGTDKWRGLAEIKDSDERAGEIVSLYSSQLNAKHVTQMNMYAENGALKYVLLHATNHPLGREKMKEAIWKVTPDGSFSAFERDNPDQIVLIRAEPDLSLLEGHLWRDFSGKTTNVEQLYKWLSNELYLKKHLHSVLTDLRERGFVKAIDPAGKFAFSHNPTITFPKDKPY